MSSIRGRLTLWLTACTVLLALGAGALLYAYIHAAILGQFDAALYERAHSLASLLRIEKDGRLGMDFSDDSMPEYFQGKNAEYFEAILADGQVVERSLSLGQRDLVDLHGLRISHPAVWNLRLPDGRPGRAVVVLARPTPDSEDRDEQEDPGAADSSTDPIPQTAAPGQVIFFAARDRTNINHTFALLLWGMSVTGLGLAGCCVLVIRTIVARELRPLERVASRASQIGPQTLSYRFEVDFLPAELRPICLRLNDLLGRLEDAFKRERRINADIAHELRTPIAELRTLTEVAALWPDDQAQMSLYLRDAHDVALRMESLVQRLLSLARSQAGKAPAALEPLRLAPLIGQIVSKHRPEVQRRRLLLEVDVSDELIVRSDRLMFERIVENLLSNAVQYTPVGGRIDCRAQRDPAGEDDRTAGSCLLSVTNTNTSLDQPDLARLFEPFWRKDGSRSDGSRVGLGLALVQEYARQLGIEVSANLVSPGCFEMLLKVPLVAASVATTEAAATSV